MSTGKKKCQRKRFFPPTAGRNKLQTPFRNTSKEAFIISSCIVARGEETFDNEPGQELLAQWQIPEGFIARAFVLLGYCSGEYPKEKPRRDGRIIIVDEKQE